MGLVPPCHTMQGDDWGYPTTVAHWEHLFKATCKKDNYGTVHTTKGFVSQAKNMHAQQYTNAQWQVLKDWRYPHADGWQLHHEHEVCLDMPQHRDMPEYWAEWTDQNPTQCSLSMYVNQKGYVLQCRMLLVKKHVPNNELAERN